MLKNILIVASLFSASAAYAVETPITGTVESKCTIFTEKRGVYGSPTPNKLSTLPADGGVEPVVRFDIAKAGYYTARISHPNAFSSSPNLSDNVTWTGDVSVDTVSDPLMSGFETNKITYNNVTEFDLDVAGTVWFKAASTAMYGVDKSFPAGTYTAVVTAECIAK